MKPGTDLAGFKLALKNFTEKELPKKFCQLMAWTAFEVYARVLKRTPVDKGFLRGSWTVSLRAPAFEKMKTDAKFDDKPSQGEIDKSKVALDPLKFGEKIFISNRMPYVLVVEFGGYPNPPKRGTHLKKGQKKGAFVGPGLGKKEQQD